MQSRNSALNRWVAQGGSSREAAAEYGHYGQMQAPPQVQPMTLDNVVARTVGLLLLVGVSGAITWTLATVSPALAGGLAAIGAIVTLGVILVSWFSTNAFANPVLPSIYAVAAGLMLGPFSQFMESMYPGIVLQAVVGTFGVFFGMAMLYKARVVRNSPKFTKFMIGTGFGLMALLLVNFLLGIFGVDMGLFYDYGSDAPPSMLQWIIAIVFVAWAAFSFILDFDMVEYGVRYGAPKKYAWVAAFGLTAGLVFLYISILRLLSYIRQ
ncbi:MAG: Bax inhibitor-1/YccA family protein [Stackebrandtia sp.]